MRSAGSAGFRAGAGLISPGSAQDVDEQEDQHAAAPCRCAARHRAWSANVQGRAGKAPQSAPTHLKARRTSCRAGEMKRTPASGPRSQASRRIRFWPPRSVGYSSRARWVSPRNCAGLLSDYDVPATFPPSRSIGLDRVERLYALSCCAQRHRDSSTYRSPCGGVQSVSKPVHYPKIVAPSL